MQINALIHPLRLFSRHEALATPCPVPSARGAYAWWFKTIPDGVPTAGCLHHEGRILLYVGISPHSDRSTGTLRKRICRSHFNGNASGSTLRLTLGVLLTKSGCHPLRRTGRSERMTLTPPGELWLNNWMEENAKVCWVEDSSPWLLEHTLLRCLSVPLNLQGNAHHAYSAHLSALRSEARQAARIAPVFG